MREQCRSPLEKAISTGSYRDGCQTLRARLLLCELELLFDLRSGPVRVGTGDLPDEEGVHSAGLDGSFLFASLLLDKVKQTRES